jgi:pilus assembly protein CpaF
MLSALKQPTIGGNLDSRISQLSGRDNGEKAEKTALALAQDRPTPSPIRPEPNANMDRLRAARETLLKRLRDEIRPGQRSIMKRGDLAKLVNNAVQTHFAHNGINLDALSRRNFVTELIEALIADAMSIPETGKPRHTLSAPVEAAKAKIQPLVMEHMDISAAADMSRAAFEGELADWVKELLVQTRIQLNSAEQRELIETLLADILGLGPLEPLLGDETISDILINGAKQVYVERRGKLELTNVQFRDERHLFNVCAKIATRVGRRIDESVPLVDARLSDGSRVNIVVPPLALDGALVSIRKFSKKDLTLDALAANGSVSSQMATLLKVAARCRLNILISGGTGSGKTTLLNALSQMIDISERIVTIEDAAELQLQQPHVARMETRTANLEGNGQVTIRDLLRNALRMRPDRIIIGECRGGEALDMLQAMNTGHDGSMSTIHANSPRDALIRLENMVSMTGISLPSRAVRTQIASAIHLICQVNRMRDGVRRLTSITELVGMEGDVITTHELFSYAYEGEGIDGKLRGRFKSSGLRPHFLPRAEHYGLDRLLTDAI